MRRDVYEQLASILSTLPASAWPHYKLLATRFGVSVETVTSIYMQIAHAYVMKAHTAFKNDISVYSVRYQAGEDMLELCDIADMPPCMFLRRLLEQPPWCFSEQGVKRILKDPELSVQLAKDDTDNARPLAQLVDDIKLCLECDQVYSPSANAKRNSIGAEYERQLESCLDLARLAYDTEAHLREKGAFKTPDALLQVPFAVKGQTVNWIDSKATFGDDQLHREQIRQQYSKYINRYGPGMVIYWFGFIDDLKHSTTDLVLADAFPSSDDIVQLPCLLVPADLLPGVVHDYTDGLDDNADSEV